MKTRFTNETEAKVYLLENLEKKYDRKFVIAGDEKYNTVGLHDIYTCDVYAEGESAENLVNARVTDFGELTDDYIKYYYKKDAEKLTSDVLKEKKYVQSYQVELQAPWTKKKFTKEMGMEKYLAESGAYNETDIYLADNLVIEEYADEIGNLLVDLINSKVGVEVAVFANNENIYFKKFQINDSRVYSQEELIKEIESSIRMNPEK